MNCNVWTVCEEVHRVPDDVIEEEATSEAQTAESAGDVGLTTAESVSDSVSTSECVSDSVSTAAGSVEMRDNSQPDNTWCVQLLIALVYSVMQVHCVCLLTTCCFDVGQWHQSRDLFWGERWKQKHQSAKGRVRPSACRFGDYAPKHFLHPNLCIFVLFRHFTFISPNVRLNFGSTCLHPSIFCWRAIAPPPSTHPHGLMPDVDSLLKLCITYIVPASFMSAPAAE